MPALDSPSPTPPPSPHIRFCSSTHIAAAFRCYKGIYTAFYSIYAVLKCQMLPYFSFILTFIKNLALHLICRGFREEGRGAGLEKEKPSVHRKMITFFLNYFHALLRYCLDHCTEIKRMHNQYKTSSNSDLL